MVSSIEGGTAAFASIFLQLGREPGFSLPKRDSY